MTFIEWNARLEVGLPSVDAQHKTLVDTLNTLFDALQAKPGAVDVHHTLTFLLEYTADHFRQEEHLMVAADYPAFSAHREEHLRLMAQVQAFRDKEQRRASFLSLELLQFLREWLCTHILDTDRRMAEWMKQHHLG